MLKNYNIKMIKIVKQIKIIRIFKLRIYVYNNQQKNFKKK